MGRLHRVADVEEEPQTGLEPECVALAVGVDRLAVDPLHHQVGSAASRHTTIEKTRDAGMVEPGEDLSLPLEASDALSVDLRDKLQCAGLTEVSVGPFDTVDDTHAAPAQLVAETPRTEGLVYEPLAGGALG